LSKKNKHYQQLSLPCTDYIESCGFSLKSVKNNLDEAVKQFLREHILIGCECYDGTKKRLNTEYTLLYYEQQQQHKHKSTKNPFEGSSSLTFHPKKAAISYRYSPSSLNNIVHTPCYNYSFTISPSLLFFENTEEKKMPSHFRPLFLLYNNNSEDNLLVKSNYDTITSIKADVMLKYFSGNTTKEIKEGEEYKTATIQIMNKLFSEFIILNKIQTSYIESEKIPKLPKEGSMIQTKYHYSFKDDNDDNNKKDIPSYILTNIKDSGDYVKLIRDRDSYFKNHSESMLAYASQQIFLPIFEKDGLKKTPQQEEEERYGSDDYFKNNLLFLPFINTLTKIATTDVFDISTSKVSKAVVFINPKAANKKKGIKNSDTNNISSTPTVPKSRTANRRKSHNPKT